jgi:hypothetical protein
MEQWWYPALYSIGSDRASRKGLSLRALNGTGNAGVFAKLGYSGFSSEMARVCGWIDLFFRI